MNVAVIGSGGREHAILWKLAQDSRIHRLYALPGNGGTTALAESVLVAPERVVELRQAVRRIQPDLVVVGPEIPLALGIADSLRNDNIPCFGPSASAARIETSKVFAKRLMASCGIPTAAFEIFDSFTSLEAHVNKNPSRTGWVVKADGLAAGKGAFVCADDAETLRCAHGLLIDGWLGDAGRSVVLEERLFGVEASALFWCDGQHVAALPAAQDYKRANDGNQGPNTGGMGSLCPTSVLSGALTAKVQTGIVQPMVDALAANGAEFRGILYAGLMITEAGPKVIEFNCRMGDPETQAILPVLDGNIVDTMLGCANGMMDPVNLPAYSSRAAVCVVLAAEGYPGSYTKGIDLNETSDSSNSLTFHAGTSRKEGRLLSTGGRVLNAVGIGSNLNQARVHAYELASRLRVPGLFFRNDIALDA